MVGDFFDFNLMLDLKRMYRSMMFNEIPELWLLRCLIQNICFLRKCYQYLLLTLTNLKLKE